MLSAVGVMALTGCDDQKIEYVPGVPSGGDAAYFNPELSSTFNLKEDGSSFSITVFRTEDKGQLTVPIQVEAQEGNTLDQAFTFPSSVSFADGEKSTEFVVLYDIEQFKDGDSYFYDEEQQFMLTIDEQYKIPYGMSNLLITAVLPAPWMELGEGTYIDEGWYVNDDGDSTTVTFYQNELDPYLFRITNPYTFDITVDRPEYFQFRILQPGQTVLDQTIPNNLGVTLVYFSDFPVEYHPTYDEDVYLIYPGRFGWPVEQWVYNYVVDWQDEENLLPGEIHLSPYYFLFGQSGGWNYTTDEPITIVFPGYETLDTSVSVTYNGMLNKPDDSMEAVAYVELGADVTEAKVAIVPGSTVNSNLISEITDGTISGKTITSSGQVNLDFNPESAGGKYSIVAVTYYQGEARENSYVTFNYTPATAETWSLVGEGLYTYLDFWVENLDLEPEVLELYESDATPGKFKITHWFYDSDFVFTVNEDGTIYVAEEQPTGASTSSGEIWVDDFSLWGEGAGELKDGVYYFAVMYYNSLSGNYYAYGFESFEPVTAETKTAAKTRNSSTNIKKMPSKKFHQRGFFSSTIKKNNVGMQFTPLMK